MTSRMGTLVQGFVTVTFGKSRAAFDRARSLVLDAGEYLAPSRFEAVFVSVAAVLA